MIVLPASSTSVTTNDPKRHRGRGQRAGFGGGRGGPPEAYRAAELTPRDPVLMHRFWVFSFGSVVIVRIMNFVWIQPKRAITFAASVQ